MKRRYTAAMTMNSIDTPAIGALEAEIFSAFGETDSIIDRLLSMPHPPAGAGGVAQWEAGVVRRMEKVLSDRIRERLGARVATSQGDQRPVSYA